MPSDKKDNRITFRAKPALQIKIATIKDLLRMQSESDAVRHLVETGIAFYELRKVEIARLRRKMKDYNIQVWELHVKDQA